MTKTSTITVERLHQLLDYNPDTGIFTWKARGVPRFDNRFADKPASTFNKHTGYYQITVDEVTLRCNRVAYAMMVGEWPNLKVDHINTVKTDNRWCNLRIANNTQNTTNSKTYATNTTGFKGVHIRKKGKPYEAAITFEGKYIYLGTYDTPEEAHAVYCEAAIKYFGEYARTG